MPVCEDLATKAELQELRDQLNTLLGERETGGSISLFQAGAGTGNILTAIGGAIYGLTKLRASNAITSIQTQPAISGSVWKAFSSGSSTIVATKGSGAVETVSALGKVAKTAGGAGGAVSMGGKAAGGSAAGVAVLAQLVTIAATLALNIATVKVLDKRIDAESRGASFQLDAINGTMLRLYEKNQGDIDAVNQKIAEGEEIAAINRQNIEIARSELLEAKDINSALVDQISQAEADIQNLQSQNEALIQEINNAQIDFENVSQDLTSSIETVQQNLTTALSTISTQKSDIEKINEEIELIETRVTDIEARIQDLEDRSTLLRVEFIQLRLDLEEDVELVDARSKLNSAKLIILENKNSSRVGGGTPIGITNGTVDGQNKILELANQLTSNPITINPVTSTDLLNNTNKFESQFENLISEVDTGTVDEQQLTDLKTDIKTDFTDVLETALQVGVIAKLNDINQKTNQTSLENAAKSAICKSLNGGSCSATPGNPNPTQGLGGMQNILSGKLDTLNAGLNGTIITQNNGIKAIVQNTNDAVRSTTYGLEKIQGFAETAWQATKADKILNAITTAMVFHNATMLSRDLGVTIGEAASTVLNAIGITDESNNPIDVNSVIRTKMNSLLTSLLGAQNYAALTAKIAKASRIYQASANILQTTQNLFDSARSVAELTAENTGQIGNALKESGAVYEDAYRDMVEQVNPQSAAMRKLDRFREGLETIEEGVSVVSNVSSEVVEVKENFEQLKTEKQAWKTEVETKIVESETEKATNKTAVQVSATIEAIDFASAETN